MNTFKVLVKFSRGVTQSIWVIIGQLESVFQPNFYWTDYDHFNKQSKPTSTIDD